MKAKDIKAQVKYFWNHPNCKFQPGEEVTVNVNHEIRNINRVYKYGTSTEKTGASNYSRPYINGNGKSGKVIAVTCTDDGKIRGMSKSGWYPRCYTRYYVEFPNGDVVGYHSHHLMNHEETERRSKTINGVKVFK
jgi:hypothetical protein